MGAGAGPAVQGRGTGHGTAPDAARDGAGGLRSADRVLQILALVGAAPQGVTARDVGAALEVSSATAYRLLGTLRSHGYLVRRPDATYALGRSVEVLGSALRRQILPTPQVVEVLDALHTGTDAPAYLTLFRDEQIVVAHISESARRPRIRELHVGFAEAAHTTAFGKLLLAGMSTAELDAYVAGHGLDAVTRRSVTGSRRLREELDEVRAQQLAVEVEEYMPRLACVAAPVQVGGATVGAVSVSVSATDFAVRGGALERAVRRGAWHVGRRLTAV